MRVEYCECDESRQESRDHVSCCVMSTWPLTAVWQMWQMWRGLTTLLTWRSTWCPRARWCPCCPRCWCPVWSRRTCRSPGGRTGSLDWRDIWNKDSCIVCQSLLWVSRNNHIFLETKWPFNGETSKFCVTVYRIDIRQQSKILILLHQLDITPGAWRHSLASEGWQVLVHTPECSLMSASVTPQPSPAWQIYSAIDSGTTPGLRTDQE